MESSLSNSSVDNDLSAFPTFDLSPSVQEEMKTSVDDLFSASSSGETDDFFDDLEDVIPHARPSITPPVEETKAPFTPQVVSPFPPGLPSVQPFAPSPFVTAPSPFLATPVTAPSPFSSSSSATPHIQVPQMTSGVPSPFAPSAAPHIQAPSPFAPPSVGAFRPGIAAPVVSGSPQPMSPIIFDGDYNEVKGKTAPKVTAERYNVQQVLSQCCGHLSISDFFKEVISTVYGEELRSIVSSGNDQALIRGILSRVLGERQHGVSLPGDTPSHVHSGCVALIQHHRGEFQKSLRSHCFSFGSAPVVPWTHNTVVFGTSPYKYPLNVVFRGDKVGVTLVQAFCYSIVMIMNGTVDNKDFVYNNVNVSIIDIALTHDMRRDTSSSRTIQMDIGQGGGSILAGQSFVSNHSDFREYIDRVAHYARMFTTNADAIISNIKFKVLHEGEMCDVIPK